MALLNKFNNICRNFTPILVHLRKSWNLLIVYSIVLYINWFWYNMTRPGFQSGANGQILGVDLYFPNTGAYAGNSQSQETTIQREEEIEPTFATTFSHVRQIIKANHEKAVLGRTTRGFTTFINHGENSAANLAIQAGSQFLPDFIPDLAGSDQPVNTLLNQYLRQI